jgi:hypothetical protein
MRMAMGEEEGEEGSRGAGGSRERGTKKKEAYILRLAFGSRVVFIGIDSGSENPILDSIKDSCGQIKLNKKIKKNESSVEKKKYPCSRCTRRHP